MLGFTGSLEGLTEFRKAVIPTFIVYYGKRTQIKIKKGKKLVVLTENEQPRKLRVVFYLANFLRTSSPRQDSQLALRAWPKGAEREARLHRSLCSEGWVVSIERSLLMKGNPGSHVKGCSAFCVRETQESALAAVPPWTCASLSGALRCAMLRLQRWAAGRDLRCPHWVPQHSRAGRLCCDGLRAAAPGFTGAQAAV